MITTMSDTAAIFRREFTARRSLLWAALYIAVLVVVVPYLPFISHWEKTDVRDLSSVALALGAGLALSLGLGATFFGRDLSEGRLGFYFERPVRSIAVWLGRFLAVLSLVVLCEVLILLPAKLSSSDGLMIMAYVGWPKDFGAVGWAVVLLAGPASAGPCGGRDGARADGMARARPVGIHRCRRRGVAVCAAVCCGRLR
jgi:hypothetical protein